VKARAATPDTTRARAAAEASVGIHGGPPVRASALALALAVALALGGTLEAAEIVAAVVEPAVAVMATLADALAEPEAEADASPPDAWARAGDPASTIVKVTAASHNESFLLDSICHSSLSSSAPNTIPSIAGIRYMAQSVHAVHQPSTIADSWKSPFRNAGGCWLQGGLTGRGVRGYRVPLRDVEY
jgi:hypothetical protein